MSVSPNSNNPTLATPANKQGIVRGIIEGLVTERWKGGDRLTEAMAVEEYGVSRTPVREALLELRGLGLLELRRNCGAVFFAFGPKELAEIYSVRTLLEIESARLAARSAEQSTIDRLASAFVGIRDSGGIDVEWKHDRELHHFIASASGNHRLAREIGRYGELVQTIREIVDAHRSGRGIHIDSADDHLAILEGLRERRPDDASQAMRIHLEKAAQSALDAMAGIRG